MNQFRLIFTFVLALSSLMTPSAAYAYGHFSNPQVQNFKKAIDIVREDEKRIKPEIEPKSH